MTPITFRPFDYQWRMIEWLLSRDVSALFCSPGLGKTGAYLWALNQWIASGDSRGGLIIAPKRVCSITWPKEIRKWEHSAWMKFADLRTEEGLQAWIDGSADVYLINPDMLPSSEIHRKCKQCDGLGEIHYPEGLAPLDVENNVADCLACGGKGEFVNQRIGTAEKLFKGRRKLPVDSFVWDELSQCKNPSSKRVNSVRPYMPKFKHRCGLTGTPVPNTYLDLFAQVRLLDGGERLGVPFNAYRNVWFESTDYMERKYALRPGAKDKIDTKLADLALVMLGDDYLDIPTCTVEDIEVTLPASAAKEYRVLEKELLLELEKSDVIALSCGVLFFKLLQLLGGAVYDEHKVAYTSHDSKIKALQKLRKKHGTEPMLVFAQYKHEYERILAAIPGAAMFDEKNMGAWRRGEIHTWISHPKSISHGIDGLQDSCHLATWFTLTPSNEDFLQTNARLARTGQASETTIYRLLVPDTIDDVVAESLREKSDTQSGLLIALKNLQALRS